MFFYCVAVNSDRVWTCYVYVKCHIIWCNRFVENLLELAGKCIYHNGTTCLCVATKPFNQTPWEKKERKAMWERSDSRGPTASTCKNGNGKATMYKLRERQQIKSRDCPVIFTSFRSSSYILWIFSHSQSTFLSRSLRSAFPLRTGLGAGSPGESRAMTK